MMFALSWSNGFRRGFKKSTRKNPGLQEKIEYDCRIVFTFENEPDSEKDLIVLVDIGRHDEVY